MNTKAKPRRPRRPPGELNQDPDRLRYRRVAAGLSVKELAAAAGVSTGTISMLEQGLTCGQPRVLKALAAAIGCQTTDIMPDLQPGLPVEESARPVAA